MAYSPTSNLNYAQTQPPPNFNLGAGFLGTTNSIPYTALQNTPKPAGLVAESAVIREQVESAKRLVQMLFQHLLEPIPYDENQAYTKDNPSTLEGNPSTLEGNLYETTHKLGSLILDLETLLQKIGGR